MEPRWLGRSALTLWREGALKRAIILKCAAGDNNPFEPELNLFNAAEHQLSNALRPFFSDIRLGTSMGEAVMIKHREDALGALRELEDVPQKVFARHGLAEPVEDLKEVIGEYAADVRAFLAARK